MKAYAVKKKQTNLKKLQNDAQIAGTVKALERHVALLYRLGYREMPLYMQEIILTGKAPSDYQDRNPSPYTTIDPRDEHRESYHALYGGLFEEVFEVKEKETYGHVTFQTGTQKLVSIDTIMRENFLIDPVAFAYDFGARLYDARVGRFISGDPLAKQFPHESPYAFVGDNPVCFIDDDGRKKTWYVILIDEKGNETALKIIDKEYVKTKVVGYTYVGYFDGKKHPVYEDYDVSQRVVIDMRKTSEEQITFEEEQEEGETKSWIGELWDQRDNLIIYGSGKFTGQIEMGSKARGKGKTVIATDEEVKDVLGAIKAAAGFKQGKTKALDAEKKIFENIDKIVKEVDKMKPKKEQEKKVVCPACGEREDSAHVDDVNGKGTYEKEVEKQKTQ